MSENANRARVACVVPYVGAWPHYAGLFFESCRYNPGLDVIVVTPQHPGGDLPPNVHVVQMSAPEIVRRLESATGLGLGSFRWHKLCDFRPFFGLAFADLLKSYEFWGYCDTDMMLGDLSSVLDPEHLSGIDAFSAHSEQFVGHFTLLRNREDINRLGFGIPDWKQLCLTEKAEHLDEERLHDVFRLHPELRVELPERLDREMTKPFCRHAITYTFYGKVADLTEAPYDVVTRWRDGKVFALRPGGRETEVLYVHFMALKHPWHWPRDVRVDASMDGSHYFSRVGYANVQIPEDLSRTGNRLRYGLQSILLDAKRMVSRTARQVLSQENLQSLRKFMRI
jgi:hypothetical protein